MERTHGRGTEPPRGAAERAVARVRGGRPELAVDALAVEEPLEIRVDGETVAVTMRTPGRDADLALGFLFAEGLIEGARDVGAIAHCGRPGSAARENVIDVRSAAARPIDVERVLEGRRWTVTTSACGTCGRRSIDALLERTGPVDGDAAVPAAVAAAAVASLAARQPLFARTGGLHAAALFDALGRLVGAAEDVGRHNAVDKVVGALLRARVDRTGGEPGAALLAVSGRSSFEIVQKAAAARVAVVASVSAPSSLAVDLARAARIGLAGFVRDGRMNVYAHAWRLGLSARDGRAAPDAPCDAPR